VDSVYKKAKNLQFNAGGLDYVFNLFCKQVALKKRGNGMIWEKLMEPINNLDARVPFRYDTSKRAEQLKYSFGKR
jgi:hypothetical protein